MAPSSLPHLIGLYSPIPQCGKSTVAAYLEHQDYRRISFADPLREIVRVVLVNLGYPTDQAQQLITCNKQEMIPALRMTVRQLLQVTGTEYLRQCVHPNVNVMMWRQRVTTALEHGHRVVCDDVRLPNEHEAVRALGGMLLHIERPDAPTPESYHSSDAGLDHFTFDCYLFNDGSIDHLHSLVEASLRMPAHLIGGAAS